MTNLDLKWNQVLTSLQRRRTISSRRPSLERMKKALGRFALNYPHDPRQVIVVAGTNGKGTVAATLSRLFFESGCQVGLFTSPHLIDPTERIRWNEEDISQAEFCQLFEECEEKAGDLRLGHFETLTLMAALYFFRDSRGKQLDYAIFEVGMGGLFDPTNAIPHGTCVITKLGLDHQKYLGPTLRDIAKAKLGIIPEKLPRGIFPIVVHSKFPQEVQAFCQSYEKALGQEWTEVSRWKMESTSKSGIQKFTLHSPWGKARLNVGGMRGAENATIALTAFKQLGFNPKLKLSSLQRVRWPGRMEKWNVKGLKCPIYFSGDHNGQGVQSLLGLLKYYRWKKLYIVFGMTRDRSPKDLLLPLLKVPRSQLYLTQPSFHAKSLTSFQPWKKRFKEILSDPAQCFEAIKIEAKKGDLVLVTGSLYLVGDIQRYSHSMRV